MAKMLALVLRTSTDEFDNHAWCIVRLSEDRNALELFEREFPTRETAIVIPTSLPQFLDVGDLLCVDEFNELPEDDQ